MLELYKNIKKLRIENKLSQDELALKTGYTDPSMITIIEEGKIDLTISKIIVFAKALNTNPSSLMGWKSYYEDYKYIIDLAKKDNLKASDIATIKVYLDLSDTQRDAFKDYMFNIITNKK
jgi:transcriptional regulator with XRE-family HTH domain